MKKTFKHFLIESQSLPHWPKTLEELHAAYKKVWINGETGEVFMPGPDTKHVAYGHVKFHEDDLSVTVEGDVKIEGWMLEGGCLPFKFREVTGEVDVIRDCRIASLVGLPKKCKSIHFEYDSLAENVKNLIGGPEEVKKYYTVSMCDGLESLEGLPKNLPADISLNFFSKNLKDISALPKRVSALTLGNSNFITVNDLKYLPEFAEEINFSSLSKLTSLHNIHKFVKRTYQLGIYECKISSSILGLALIDDLTIIDESFYDINEKDHSWPGDGIYSIVEKYIGSQDIFEFQEELVNAGLTELAKQ